MKIFNPSNPRKLWKRYTIGVLLLASLLLGSHGLHIKIIEAGANDAEIIDLAGRQRMLSQRMSGLVLSVANNPNQPLVKATLEQTNKQFSSAHETLVSSAKNIALAPEVYAVGVDAGLDQLSRDFVRNVELFLATNPDQKEHSQLMAQIQNAAFSTLLTELDSAVKAFSSHARMRNENLEHYQTLALALALLLLLAESCFIFWPAHKTVIASLNAAEQKTDQLAERNEKLQNASDQLTFAANHDHLTGLANRKRLATVLSRMLAERRADRKHLCIMHIDLDRFKEVNDSLGHPVGDAVIRRVAETMQDRVRSTDLVARVGGDEFVIVLNIDDSHPIEKAHQIADNIIERIKQPMIIEGNTCSIGASIGYIFATGANDNADELMANADIALYAAKNAGKGRAMHFRQKMRRDIEFRHALTQDLDHAISENEFVPFFQPKIDMSNGYVCGFEALARWQHPNRGLLPPAEFLDLAEEAGVIEQIDNQVMKQSLDGLVQLRNEGWDIPGIAVNTSGRSLRSDIFVENLIENVEIRGLVTSDVTVEVLESILISSSQDKAFSTLQKLTEHGFKVEIDDFGTGYASLSVLAELELSGLKIDEGLIHKLDDSKTRLVVETIIELAQRMSKEVTAEGVETIKQFAELRVMGCNAAQGYELGMPMSLYDVREWLKNYGTSSARGHVFVS